MRSLIPLLSVLIVVACGQKNEKFSGDKTAGFPSQVSTDPALAGFYVLTLENAGNFIPTDSYGDLKYRTQLTDSIGNEQGKAIKIEKYLAKKWGDYFVRTDSTLVLKYANGKTELFQSWDKQKIEGYNFVHYFDSIDYYLLRIQFGEGNKWVLVNRKNGYKKYIAGIPYIAANQQQLVTIGADLESGYNFNGLELYSIENDTLRREFRKRTPWEPVGVKWVKENQFLLKRKIYRVDSLTNASATYFDCKLVTISRKTSR